MRFAFQPFTSCDAIRNIGPTQAQVDAEYLGTNLEGLVTSSGIQLFTVPFSGTFTITAIGATGGNEAETNVEVAPAKIIGEFNLTQGEVIKILVGQHGWRLHVVQDGEAEEEHLLRKMITLHWLLLVVVEGGIR